MGAPNGDEEVLVDQLVEQVGSARAARIGQQLERALQAQLASTTLERDALKREVVAQRTPTVVEAQPAAIAPAPAVRPNAAAAAVTATAVRKFQRAGQS